MKGIKLKVIKIPNSHVLEMEISREALEEMFLMRNTSAKITFYPKGDHYIPELKNTVDPCIYGYATESDIDDDSEVDLPNI